MEPEKHGGSNKGDMRMKKRVNLAKEARPAKPRTEFKRRPQSAPNKKALKTEPEPERIALGEYSKSLKLVGVDVPSNRTEATKVKSQEIQVKTKEPTFRTRLLKRSGSYADLTKHINKDMKKSEFESVKSDLNKAIFEEWYFKKLEADREKKAKMKEVEEKKTREEEEKKRDIEEQSKVRFNFCNYRILIGSFFTTKKLNISFLIKYLSWRQMYKRSRQLEESVKIFQSQIL